MVFLKHTVSVNQCQSILQSGNKTGSKVLRLIIEKLMKCILLSFASFYPSGGGGGTPMLDLTGCPAHQGVF